MAIAVALPVLDMVAVVIVVKTKRKSLPIVFADVRIVPYDIAVRQG